MTTHQRLIGQRSDIFKKSHGVCTNSRG